MAFLTPPAFTRRLVDPLAIKFGGRGVAALTPASPSCTAVRTAPGMAAGGGVTLWPVGVRHGRR